MVSFSVERVRFYKVFFSADPNVHNVHVAEEGKVHIAINFPVGKPLEVKFVPCSFFSLLTDMFQIFIDGPYGAPSSHIFRAQHAVLVGTGIGVTPFASILQSIMHRYWKGKLKL